MLSYREPRPGYTCVQRREGLQRVIHWDEVSAQWHEDYERGRPSYPPAVVRVSGLPRSATVLEVAAGTGKLTRLLVEEFGHVVALEPDPRMRRWFVALCPQGKLLGGTAEQIPLADASADGVFVAEAFHWFAHEYALAEIARVLRPPGVLVLMWNRPAGPVEPSLDVVQHLLEPYWPTDVEMPLDLDQNRVPHAGDWPRAFAGSVFEPLQQSLFPNPHTVDRDGLVAFFGSMGWIGVLPDDERRTLLHEVRSRLLANEYTLPFETHVYVTRIPTSPDRA